MIKCEISATGPATDSWDSSRLGEQETLCCPLNIFSECLFWIKGKKFDVEGTGMWGSQFWHSGCRGIDHTGDICRIQPTTIKLNSPSLHARDCKLITLGVWNGSASMCINFWSNYLVLNTDACENSWHPTQGTLYQCYPTKWIRENPALNANLEPGVCWGLVWAATSSVGVLGYLIHPLMTEAWHTKQNFVWMYKHYEFMEHSQF